MTKKVNKKKELQAERDKLAAKLKKQQTAAATASKASDDDEADDQQSDHQRLCPHLRALSSTRYKTLAVDVQAWLTKHATAPADAPTVFCLECGYQGEPPMAQLETKEEEEEVKEEGKEVGDSQNDSPQRTQQTSETKEQLVTQPPSTSAASASHFHTTHFVGLQLSSTLSLVDCTCYRCNVTLADALLQSTQHVKLNKLASFITSLTSPATSPTPASTATLSVSSSSSPATAPSSIVTSLSVGSAMRGCQNLGNTCFFNSVVQCLAASRPLLAALFPPPVSAVPQPLQHQLSLFLTNMNTPLSSLSSLSSTNKRGGKPSSLCSSASSYSPGALLSAVQAINSQFKGGRQQDAHELLRCILSALVTEREEQEKRKRREQLVAAIKQWTAADVEKVLVSAGMRGGGEGEVMKRLEEIAGKERGGSGDEAATADGAVVVLLLERWETKEGKRWRKALSEGLDDEDKKRLERCFSFMRHGRLPSVTAATAEDSPADSDGEEEAERAEGKKGRRTVELPADSVVHRVFGGVMQQCVTCLSCCAASWTEEIFFDLSLPIEPPRPTEFVKRKDERRGPLDRASAVKPRALQELKPKKAKDSEHERHARELAAKEHERMEREQQAQQAAEQEEAERRYLLRLEEAQREEVTLPTVVRRKKQQPAQFLRKGKKMSQAEKRKLKEKERRKSGTIANERAGEEEKEEDGLEEAEQQPHQDEKEEMDSGEEERKQADDAKDSGKLLIEAHELQEERREERKEEVVEQDNQPTDHDQPSTVLVTDVVQSLEERKAEQRDPPLVTGDIDVSEQKEQTTAPLLDGQKAAMEQKERFKDREVIDLTGDSDDDDVLMSLITADIKQLSLTPATHQPTETAATTASSTPSPSASQSPSPPLLTSRLLSGACTVLDCLQSFFDSELLTGSNQFICSSCSSLASLSSSALPASAVCKRDATRRCYLRLLPAVLTIHLKRFSASASGRTMEKLNKPVSFPAQLDLAHFTRTSDAAAAAGCVYGLYGVVCHSGGMGGGHYVCYVRRGGGGWWYASDSAVREASEGEVLKAQAYILFYERLLDDSTQQHR